MMLTPRKALGELTPSSLNKRGNQNDRPFTAKKNEIQPSNQNPFATKSMVSRTPDAFSSMKRKSMGKILVIPALVVAEHESVSVKKVEELISPAGLVATTSTAKVIHEKFLDFKDRSFMKFASCESFLHIPIDQNEDTSSNDEEIEEIMSADYSMSSFCTTKIQSKIDTDLDELNIDEVLQAFRADAEAAEKAIVMATTCGRLHPTEFREYLKAFMSPKTKESIKEKENFCGNEDSKITEEEINHNQNFSTTASTFLLEQRSNEYSNQKYSNRPTSYKSMESNIFSSPKSSLLNMLQMADTPIENNNINSNEVLSRSPINECKNSLLIINAENENNIDDNLENQEIMIDKDIEQQHQQRELKNNHDEELPSQTLKERATAMRLIVATAVPSVSNVNINIPFSTPTHTIAPTPPPQLDIETPVVVPSQITKNPHPNPIISKNMPTNIPKIPPQIDEQEILETKNLEEVFNPRRIMLRTPPRNIPTSDSRESSIPENCSENILHKKSIERCVESSSLRNISVAKNVPLNVDKNVPDFCCEDVSRRSREEKVPLILMENVLCNNVPHDTWSNNELNHVSLVMKRISMNVTDCSNTRNIIEQLQYEISRLKDEVTNHHGVLAAINAERNILSQRLLETESLVHDTSKNILLLAADKRSAAYNEGRIDAEIKAAKENVENLSFLKSAIIERRAARDSRLILMDQEVAAEIASMELRKQARVGCGLHRLKMIADAAEDSPLAKNVLSDNCISFVYTSVDIGERTQFKSDQGTEGRIISCSKLFSYEPEKNNNNDNDKNKEQKNENNNDNELQKIIIKQNFKSSPTTFSSAKYIQANNQEETNLNSNSNLNSNFNFYAPYPTKNSGVVSYFEAVHGEGSSYILKNTENTTAFHILKNKNGTVDMNKNIIDGNITNTTSNIFDPINQIIKNVNKDKFNSDSFENEDNNQNHSENDNNYNNDNDNDDAIVNNDNDTDKNNEIDNNIDSNPIYEMLDAIENNQIEKNYSKYDDEKSPLSPSQVFSNDVNNEENFINSEHSLNVDDNNNNNNSSSSDDINDNINQNNVMKRISKNKRINTVCYYGNLKFIPLKVKSTKPFPIEETDYISSEIFHIEIDREDDIEEVINKKNKKVHQKRKEKKGNNEATQEYKNKKDEKMKMKNYEKNIIKTKLFDDLIELNDLNECGIQSTNEMDIIDNNSNDKDDANEESVLKDDEKTNKKKIKIAKITREMKMLNEDNENRKTIKYDIDDVEKNNVIDVKMKSKGIGKRKKKELENDNTVDQNKNESNFEQGESIHSENEKIKILSKIEMKNKKQKFQEKIIISKDNEDNSKEKTTNLLQKIPLISIISSKIDEVPLLRAVTPYALFCIDEKIEMEKLDNNFLTYSTSDIVKILSNKWKKLKLNDKKRWIEKSNLLSRKEKKNEIMMDMTDRNKNGNIIKDTKMNGDKEEFENEKEIENNLIMENNFNENLQSSDFENKKEKKNLANEISNILKDITNDNINSKLNFESNKKEKSHEVENKNKNTKNNIKKLKIQTIDSEDFNQEENNENDEVDLFEAAIAINAKSKSKLITIDKKRKKNDKKESSNCPSNKKLRSDEEHDKKHSQNDDTNSPKENKNQKENLFSSTFSLSPVLQSSSSPVIEITKRKKKIQKRVEIPIIVETLIPFPIDEKSNDINNNIDTKSMPPPALKYKNQVNHNSESDPSSSHIHQNNNNSYQDENNQIQAYNQNKELNNLNSNHIVRDLPRHHKSLLNTSVSTISSLFSTSSTVRSKSQFVLPKLKKKN